MRMGTLAILLVIAAVPWQAQQAPSCQHPGLAANADAVLPAVPLRAHDIGVNWQKYMPEHQLAPRSVRVSYRIDEQGAVSSVCIEQPVNPRLDAAVHGAVKKLRFFPATRRGTAVAVVVTRRFDLLRRSEDRATGIADSEDIAWLEGIVRARESTTDLLPRRATAGDARHLRTSAYARLGELGTSASLAAIRSIDEALTKRTGRVSAGAMTETQNLLRRAAFAVFTVGGLRSALIVEDDVDRIGVDGYPGPILYGVSRKDWTAGYGGEGVFVSWRVVRQEQEEAVVEIRHSEARRPTHLQDVFLRKTEDMWVVVAWLPTFGG